MVADRAVKAGESVYIRYNVMSNLCFFLNYGFVQLGND